MNSSYITPLLRPILCILMLVVSKTCLVSGEEKSVKTHCDQLKEFTTNPPIIESLVYQIVAPVQLSTHKPSYFELKLQPGAVLLREFETLDQLNDSKLSPNGYFICNFKMSYCCRNAHSGKFVQWDGTAAPAVEAAMFRSILVFGSMPLCLGINEALAIEPAGGVKVLLKWENNEFKFQSMVTPGEVMNLKGCLQARDGRATLLELVKQRPTDRYEYKHRIEYQYSSLLPLPFLPNRMLYLVNVDHRVPELGADITIISIKTRTSPMDKKQFDPQPFIQNNPELSFVPRVSRQTTISFADYKDGSEREKD